LGGRSGASRAHRFSSTLALALVQELLDQLDAAVVGRVREEAERLTVGELAEFLERTPRRTMPDRWAVAPSTERAEWLEHKLFAGASSWGKRDRASAA
jgi:hypothetical protein